MNKILVMGASGSGTSTVARALSIELGYVHIESDDLFWIPTDPPYTDYNDIATLELLVDEKLMSAASWVLSGSPCGWADNIIPTLDLVVFLVVPTDIRIARIRKREAERFGSRISIGGDMYHSHQQFIDWTGDYDKGNITGRNKPYHELWLKSVSCPVVRFEGEIKTDEIISLVKWHRLSDGE